MIVAPIAIGNPDRQLAAAAWRVDASLEEIAKSRYEILGTARIGGINDRPTIAGNREPTESRGIQSNLVFRGCVGLVVPLPLLLSRTFGQEWFFAINNSTVFTRAPPFHALFASRSASPRMRGRPMRCNYICTTRRCKAFRILLETEFHRFLSREIRRRREESFVAREEKPLKSPGHFPTSPPFYPRSCSLCWTLTL